MVVLGWDILVTTVGTHGDLISYSVVPLVEQIAGTMNQQPTQSYYPDTNPTSACLILVIPPRVGI